MYREPPREDPSQNHTEEGSSSVSLEHPAEQPPAVPDEYTAPAPDGGAPRPPRNNSLRQALSRAAERRTARRLARETRLEQRRTARREKRIARARERARIRDEKAKKRAERARKRAELRLMRIHPHQGRAPKRSDAVDKYGNFAGSVRKGVWTSRDGTPNGTFVKEEEGVFLRLDDRRVGYLDQHRDVRTLSHEYVASLRFKVFSVPFTFLWFAVIFLFVISVAIGFRFFVVSERLGLDLPDNYTISAGSGGGWELNIDHPVRFTDEEGEDQVVIKSMCALCLSYDHRIIDGADAAMMKGKKIVIKIVGLIITIYILPSNKTKFSLLSNISIKLTNRTCGIIARMTKFTIYIKPIKYI